MATAKTEPMKLRELIIDKAIIPTLVATKRDDAIHELLDALVAAGKVSPQIKATFLKSIIDREKRGSTGLGKGVATPHAKHKSVTRPFVAVGVSKAGVEFNSSDKQPVHSIFMLISPEESPELHLAAIQSIYSQLSKDQFRNFLRQASTVAEVITILDEADAGH